MGTTECSQCHSRANPDAAIFVAVNGVELSPDQMLTMAPGQSFEIDFYFRGMLGDPKRFRGVGAQLVIPAKPPWRIAPGGLSHPKSWSPQDEGAAFWSPAWDKAANAEGSRVTRWLEAADLKGAYHLTLDGKPLKPEWAPVVFDDRGDAEGADPDGVADLSGADATISIPGDTPAGEYPILVSGVGHDSRNVGAMVSVRFTVRVDPNARVSPTPRPQTPAQTFSSRCGRCHALKREFLSSIAILTPDDLTWLVTTSANGKPHEGMPGQGGLSPVEVDGILQYLRQQAFRALRSSGSGAPNITHSVLRRLDCLDCHDTGGMRPMPKAHGYTSSAVCGSCHFAPTGGAPPIPHITERGDRCLSCHAKGMATRAKSVTDSHGERTDGTCLSCHFDKRTEALLPNPTATPTTNPSSMQTLGSAPTTATATPAKEYATSTFGSLNPPPDAPHRVEGREEECLQCHGLTAAFPYPMGHWGRASQSCAWCHQQGRMAPLITHEIQGREGKCGACHGLSGIIPYPTSHANRTEQSCTMCHEAGSPAAGGLSSRIPRVVKHPASVTVIGCLSCHGQGNLAQVPVVPANHVGFTDNLCLMCHVAEFLPPRNR